MLSGINPEVEQTFRSLKSARAELLFTNTITSIRNFNEAKEGTADTTYNFYLFKKLNLELKSMVIKEVDETTYRIIAR